MADDLFAAIGDTFRKRRVDDPPSDWILNRFMASLQPLAPFAAEISLRIRDRAMAWEVWRSAVPRMNQPPRLKYPAPKKPPEADALATALMQREGMSRTAAEDAVGIITAAGRVGDVAAAYGVDL